MAPRYLSFFLPLFSSPFASNCLFVHLNNNCFFNHQIIDYNFNSDWCRLFKSTVTFHSFIYSFIWIDHGTVIQTACGAATRHTALCPDWKSHSIRLMMFSFRCVKYLYLILLLLCLSVPMCMSGARSSAFWFDSTVVNCDCVGNENCPRAKTSGHN